VNAVMEPHGRPHGPGLGLEDEAGRAVRRDRSPLLLAHELQHRETNVTRLLCAGAHLDAGFCDQVLDELVKQRHRRVAPAYGYNCVAVLAHALDARRRRRLRSAALSAALVPAVLIGFDGAHTLEWALLAVWWAWAVVFCERLVCVHTLISQLLRPESPSAVGPVPRGAPRPAGRITFRTGRGRTDGRVGESAPPDPGVNHRCPLPPGLTRAAI